MKLIKPKVEILDKINGDEVITKLARVARTCYKSEDASTLEKDKRLVENLIKSGHEAMIEFFDVTVKFTTDRAIANEIVRHRMASYAQESTRYCNYSKDKFGNELTFIRPIWYDSLDITHKQDFEIALERCEDDYLEFIRQGWTPQQARAILPLTLKTELNMKANLREWRCFFKLRCDTAAHPDMRKLALDLLEQMHSLIPVVFDDIYEKYGIGTKNEQEEKV